MKEFKPTKLDKETTDGTVRNLDALYQLFPSCFTEAQDAVIGVNCANCLVSMWKVTSRRSTTLLGLAKGQPSARQQLLVVRRCVLVQMRA